MNSFLSYAGGKSRLATRIVKLIPEDHETYIEPFCGGSWVLFAKPEAASRSEIINDINGELVNLYKIIKNHLDEFIRYLRWLLVSREEYERFLAMDPTTMTDVQRAVRFYYLQRLGYGGRVDSHHLAIARGSRPPINLLRIEEQLSEAHIRLSRVWIEHRPYQEMLKRYDGAKAFFYLDPPYHGYEDMYGPVFSEEDFETLRDLLAGLSGRFLMSINDTPYIRKAFRQFKISTVDTRWVMSPTRAAVRELLIKNY